MAHLSLKPHFTCQSSLESLFLFDFAVSMEQLALEIGGVGVIYEAGPHGIRRMKSSGHDRIILDCSFSQRVGLQVGGPKPFPTHVESLAQVWCIRSAFKSMMMSII